MKQDQARKNSTIKGVLTFAGGFVACFAALLVLGCASPTPITHASKAYMHGLTVSADIAPPPPGSEAEKRGIQGVIDLFEVYSTHSISTYGPTTYAESLYFRDGFKELTHRNDIVTYLMHGAQPLRECTFDFQQVTRDGNDFFFRWIMNVSLESDPDGHSDQALGMSHIRFNEDGQVVFQQDYWDPTDVLYRRIPIASGLIKMVKDRL